MLQKILLGCGTVSSALYVAVELFAVLQYEGYKYTEQQVSELLAAGSPVRPLMVTLNAIPYNLLVLAFAVGVWIVAGRKRAGRVCAALLGGYAVASAVGDWSFSWTGER